MAFFISMDLVLSLYAVSQTFVMYYIYHYRPTTQFIVTLNECRTLGVLVGFEATDISSMKFTDV